MIRLFASRRHWCVLASTTLAFAAAPAAATNGYFSNGTSVASKGMAGSGVAIGTGIMGLTANPAMGTRYPDQAEGCLSLFSPKRSTTITGMGTFESDKEFFAVPCGGANFRLKNDATLGVLMYGNGGMNTEYPTNFFGGGVVPGPLGVNLEQLFIQVNYAKDLGNGVSLGFAPILAAQRFSATGLSGFSGFSADPAALTDNGDDWSFGAGAMIGATVDAGNGFTFGASYRSRIYMEPFEKYSGLFAEGGDFDIPATAKLGLSYNPQANAAWTFTAEWERIFYSKVAALGNQFPSAGPLGAANGPGFGWKDMDVIRIGAEYQMNPKWTVRGGLSYNTSFTDSSQTTLNALAPATPQWHASIGGTMRINDRREFHIAYTHAFDNSLSGVLPSPPFPGAAPISTQMSQDELSFAMTWKW
ncbi:Outer membrane protein transport protein (OMPP1/FadL/TodX) [Thalassovita gelatinovora]|uniref:Outer membrane protein transport protein (OMPP1/FadL/TodX) n=1 Tax=Thalassovita gelatinovora TaxID=53501 RepID=A0A0P1F441_THAGE|nr:outer membrane protein transport protein [Thalassovita gelatinovora]QIZ79298.1 long-chain fatty acid transporter [Thalassovita gelatinovora]CUH62527.1 Outer membrane protein transport protein (OMPP1/FadL/TodX) [Thalassovita gelatinovora]SEQ05980.1 long-chain fatty acid transport protein [Thalassovita gelatinovora]